MSYPHQIRLRGPWQAEPIDPPGEPRRVILPATLAGCGLGNCRRVRFRRRFGRPRQIDAYERVWLVGEPITGRAAFQLNGRELATVDSAVPFSFPVTDLLAERNELTIDLTVASGENGLSGDIALEIRCAAYLTGLRRLPVGDRSRVTGTVAGDWDDRLEVYVLADGRTVGYQVCSVGEEFDILTDPLPGSPGEVRIDLVNGGVIWCSAETGQA